MISKDIFLSKFSSINPVDIVSKINAICTAGISSRIDLSLCSFSTAEIHIFTYFSCSALSDLLVNMQ